MSLNRKVLANSQTTNLQEWRCKENKVQFRKQFVSSELETVFLPDHTQKKRKVARSENKRESSQLF